MIYFSKEQIAYIEREVKAGLPLMDAIGRAEVLEQEANFRIELISACNDEKVKEALRNAVVLRYEGERD